MTTAPLDTVQAVMSYLHNTDKDIMLRDLFPNAVPHYGDDQWERFRTKPVRWFWSIDREHQERTVGIAVCRHARDTGRL